jgi:hypothetical protein
MKPRVRAAQPAERRSRLPRTAWILDEGMITLRPTPLPSETPTLDACWLVDQNSERFQFCGRINRYL